MADPITIGLIATSTFLTAGSAISEGNAAETAGRMQKQQLDQNAAATMADASLEAYESRKEGDRVASDAVAATVAGGGSASDAASIERLAKINSKADYNVLSALATGQRQSDALRLQGENALWEGKVKKKNSRLTALSSIVSGASGAWSSYKTPPAKV